MQVLLREYVFTAPVVFSIDDIVALVPVIKHTNFRVPNYWDNGKILKSLFTWTDKDNYSLSYPQPAEVAQLYKVAVQQLSGFNLKKALEMFTEALQLFNQVYGPMHMDIANCYLLVHSCSCSTLFML